MNTILEDYIVVVPAQDVNREEFEKHSGRIFKDHLNDFYDELDVPMMEAYPLEGFLEALNDGLVSIVENNLVIKVLVEVPEPTYNIIYKENDEVAKSRLTQKLVNSYMRNRNYEDYYIKLVE